MEDYSDSIVSKDQKELKEIIRVVLEDYLIQSCEIEQAGIDSTLNKAVENKLGKIKRE